MGDPSATEEKLLAVLKKVNLYEFFQTQNGLDTMLDEQAAICLVDRNRDFVSRECFFMTVHSIF